MTTTLPAPATPVPTTPPPISARTSPTTTSAVHGPTRSRPAASTATPTSGAPENPDPPPRHTTSAPSTQPPPSSRSSPPGHVLGRRGEDLAAQYLETLGLVLLCRNWRCRHGELDIIATDGYGLVVAEVKTRSSDDFGTPADAMTPAKIRRIRAATHAWLRNFGVPWCEISYDLISVWWPATGTPRLQHRRGAF